MDISSRIYAEIASIQRDWLYEQNSEKTISDKNTMRSSIDHGRVGSIARVPRLVDTASTHQRVSLDDDIVQRDTGFRSIFFCWPSATAL